MRLPAAVLDTERGDTERGLIFADDVLINLPKASVTIGRAIDHQKSVSI